MRASAALAILTLASCEAAPLVKQAREASQSGDERRITGVLTLYTEGESFRQCPLREPWNCFEAKGPVCGFDATPEARTLINTEITKAGATQGIATFGIVMLGTRVDGVRSGHLSEYPCEFRARSVLHVKEVASWPPDTSEAVDHIKIKDRVVLSENLGAAGVGTAAQNAAVHGVLAANGFSTVGAARSSSTGSIPLLKAWMRSRPIGRTWAG